jgi:exosortase
MDFLAEGSILVSLAGVCLCLGGPGLLRVAAPSIAFLVFMLPLPYRVESALGQPLQRLATLASTYVLQTLGFYASARGNIIELNSTKLGVVEACSGLGMLVTFFAMTVAVAIVLERPLLDRVIIVLSAIPVSLIANVVRITATGILGETIGAQVAHEVYHKYAGLLILMPLALALIWLELKILERLLVEVPAAGKPVLVLGLAPAVRPTERTKKNKARVRS